MTLQGDMLPLFSLWLLNKAEYITKVNTSESSVLVKCLSFNISVSDIIHGKQEGVHGSYWKNSLTVGKLRGLISLRC